LKTPLNYQVSEYDCGTISFLNALSFILERENFPGVILKKIFKCTLDVKDKMKNPGQGGTSRKAIFKLVKWINIYSQKNALNIFLKLVKNEDVTLKCMNKTIKNKGCLLVRSYLVNAEHYFIITKITKHKVFIFDPYYLNKKIYNKKSVKLKNNHKFCYNRIISKKLLMSSEVQDFALGPIKKREVVLIYKI